MLFLETLIVPPYREVFTETVRITACKKLIMSLCFVNAIINRIMFIIIIIMMSMLQQPWVYT